HLNKRMNSSNFPFIFLFFLEKKKKVEFNNRILN
ncbi:unnamed protein product, partial [marine sediment metagenome]